MAAVPMAAVTMPLEHRASTARKEQAVCCTALACSELDTSFFHPCRKEDALSELGAVHQPARLNSQSFQRTEFCPRIHAWFCEHLAQHRRSIHWTEDLPWSYMGFGVLTVANQHSLTHMLPNTNQNEVKREGYQKIPFEKYVWAKQKNVIQAHHKIQRCWRFNCIKVIWTSILETLRRTPKILWWQHFIINLSQQKLWWLYIVSIVRQTNALSAVRCILYPLQFQILLSWMSKGGKSLCCNKLLMKLCSCTSN